MQRRAFLQTTAFAAIASAIGARGASAADPLGIALVLPSPNGDVGWSHTLVAGLDPVIAAYGDAVKITLLENIAEGPDADRIMTNDDPSRPTLTMFEHVDGSRVCNGMFPSYQLPNGKKAYM